MHHDEANQAVKFGALLEKGEYVYDKTDHHGPLLYYITLPAAKAMGRARFQDLDESLLRTVPALFGAALIALFLLFGSSIDLEARAVSVLLMALSPAMTFYSRFYIQEMLFAFFAMGFLVSIWRYILRPDGGWYAMAGIFAGLMAATKETAVIVLAAAALGLIAVLIRERISVLNRDMPVKRKVFARHVIIALIAAVAVAALFYSSFGTNLEGIKDAVSSLNVYVERGSDATGIHTHPFFYYFGILAGRISGGLVWTEILVLLLGLAGMVFVFIRRPDPVIYTSDPVPVDRSLGLFLVVYTVGTTLAYSFLPYKTPWNLVPFYLGWLILAGIGAIRHLPLRPDGRPEDRRPPGPWPRPRPSRPGKSPGQYPLSGRSPQSLCLRPDQPRFSEAPGPDGTAGRRPSRAPEPPGQGPGRPLRTMAAPLVFPGLQESRILDGAG